MKLRGRFTLTLALAALVPITVAAVVTRQVIADSYRSDYDDNRRVAEAGLRRELGRLTFQVSEAASSLADPQDPFIGVLLGELGKGTLSDGRVLKSLRERGGGQMRGLSLQVLTVTGPDDVVLITPHYRDATDDVNPLVRQRAIKTGGTPYFVYEQVRVGPTVETVLVAQAAHLARKEEFSVALWAGRKVTGDVLDTVRRPGRVDARLVDPAGRVRRSRPGVARRHGDVIEPRACPRCRPRAWRQRRHPHAHPAPAHQSIWFDDHHACGGRHEHHSRTRQ